MKYIRILFLCLFVFPFGVHAAGGQNEFMVAAQLLAAARNADIQQVQILVNNGADINYVDATGLSLVCTALMNNDTRAAQILQMYGADASQCDRQIKKYNNRTKPKPSGGLFSGLSSAQSLTLAAAGAAVVVGGLLLLTDVLDPGNDNENSNSSGGTRPGGGGNSGSGGDATAGLTVPYSPAYLGINGYINTSNEKYLENLQTWNPSEGGIRQADFNYFRPTVAPGVSSYLTDGVLVPVQNYLLMMHGYSAFANGYMGQLIFRNSSNNYNPLPMENSADGGEPVAVGLVTKNGVNPTGSAARGDENSVGILAANSAGAGATTYVKDKYLNYNNPTDGVLGTEISDMGFDLSGAGTAMNPFASAYDSSLMKIVAGWTGNRGGYEYDDQSYVDGDFWGFVPNGRVGVYRTGGGQTFVNIEKPTEGAVLGTSSSENAIGAGDTIVLNGVIYTMSLATDSSVTEPTITVNGTTYDVPLESTMLRGVCTSDVTDDCEGVSDIAIYKGTDGYYYVNTTGGTNADAVYVVSGNNIYAQKELQNTDYRNFEALVSAKSASDVIANVAVIQPSRSTDYVTVSDMPQLIELLGGNSVDVFVGLVNDIYDVNTTQTTTQGIYANQLFGGYNANSPILVMSAGEFEYGYGAGKSLSVLDATFENYAPALYSNLEHLFMTVVAVKHKTETASADSISEYGNGTDSNYGPLTLSYWTDYNGTIDDTSDDVTYKSRKCGIAGLGINGIDPWCFAAAGATAEMATAAAAGAVASLKAAFAGAKMTNSELFTLLALTADGPYLGTDDNGNAFTKDTLASYLRGMYELPPEYYEDTLDSEAYLNAFAEVYGYGLINLERAMTPNKKLYFFDGKDIVSGDKNAYWRAATNTSVRASSVFNLDGVRVSTAVFDVLESVEGEMRLPRVWESEFTLGNTTKRGLYMGDVLGELKTRNELPAVVKIGDISFAMAVSERAYIDNMGGLDNLSLAYSNDNWSMGASYQHYFTDGVSRFNGMANPILNLASNVVTTGAEYKFGNWSFGGRGYSGLITDESLLENDPTISAQYMPGKLGRVSGAESHIKYGNENFVFTASVGATRESDTLLGAVTDGLLSLGAGDTTYIDVLSRYDLSDSVGLTARATFANTVADASGAMVLGMTDIESNSFAFGANIGNLELTVAQPLAITDGALQYAHAEYDVVEVEDGYYDLVVRDARIADLQLRPEAREVRFGATYRHSFGEFTDGALGFIYRVNPNHTDAFGNESIFMMKLSHRLGI